MFDFICGIIIFIVLIFVVLAILGTNKNTRKMVEAQSRTPQSKLSDRYCPGCGRGIPFDSNSCPYCGKKFNNTMTGAFETRKQNTMEEETENNIICSSCGGENKPGSKYCKKCGNEIND